MSRKLLLSSVCQPFGPKYGDGFGVSYEGSHQILWAQGIFRNRATTTQWGIDFIAENLKIPTKTLHYPTMATFIEEIEKGYDYIGIAFVSPTKHKMLPMVEAIRKYAPESKIILGGYGTALGDELIPYADYICQEEGVTFMRKLLGEPEDAPITQPIITQSQTLFGLPMGGRLGYVFAGLGCPNGCDFCATSHYFKQKHIRFLADGPEILDAIQRLRGIYPDMVDFWISDEDFLLDEKRGRSFLDAIRKSNLPPLNLSVFASIKALSQYKVSELVEMGIDWVWVGFEGERAGFKKMEGRSYRELFDDLHRHGISVLASMIIGFDYQTPEVIQQEFEELMSIRPSMCQFLIYGATHGTPLYERLKKEGRLVDEIYRDNRLHDGFTLGFEHPHISRDEMSVIQRNLFKTEYEQLGPTIYRTVEDWLEGYNTLKEHSSARVRAKAEVLKKQAHRAMTVIPASKRYVNGHVVDWLDRLQHRLGTATGPLTLKEQLMARAAPALLWYTDMSVRLDIGQQPEFTQRYFRMDPTPSPWAQLFRNKMPQAQPESH